MTASIYNTSIIIYIAYPILSALRAYGQATRRNDLYVDATPCTCH